MNERSSRSHTIFRMTIESKSDDELGAVKVSVLNLVDLAGSERVGHTGAEGIRLKEGGHINKSLLTLGSVIGKLSDGGDKYDPNPPPTPFQIRSLKNLTRIFSNLAEATSHTATQNSLESSNPLSVATPGPPLSAPSRPHQASSKKPCQRSNLQTAPKTSLTDLKSTKS